MSYEGKDLIEAAKMGLTEERVREIVAEEIGKLSLTLNIEPDGYGSCHYVSAYLRYDGGILSESNGCIS
jgi:hypothetical protein